MPLPLETNIATPPRPNTKRHLAAAALSAVVPGAGQFYLGKRRKAVATFAVLIAVSIGFWPFRMPRSYTNLMLLIWALILLSLYAVYEALFGRDLIPSCRPSRWWILAAIPIHYIGFTLLFTALLFGSGFHTARIVGSSMEPLLVNRDRLVYDTACYHSQPKRRGDIIVFHHRVSLFVKRIVAIGGDTVEGNEQEILLNGQPLRDNSDSRRFGPVTVAPGNYFVLGDNLGMSFDSRESTFGLVGDNAIVGKALYAYQITGRPLSRSWTEVRPPLDND